MAIKEAFKRRFEIWLLRGALWALDRNVQRCKWISRKDNNYLFNVHGELQEILKRMENGYS